MYIYSLVLVLFGKGFTFYNEITLMLLLYIYSLSQLLCVPFGLLLTNDISLGSH